MVRAWMIGPVLALVTLGVAQSGLDSLKKRSVAPANGPVTQAEVALTMRRIETTFFRLTRQNKTLPPMVSSANPAQRGEILTRMVRLVDELKGEFKFTPKRIAFDARSITVKSPARSQIERLVSWGFVAKTSPLVTGTKETLTTVEFGDAIGLYISRLADLTHTPSSKWSPFMSGGGNN